MREERSQWRRSSAGAHDLLLRTVDEGFTRCFDAARRGAMTTQQAREEAAELRELALGVDGFDRAAVDAALETVRDRVALSK